MILQKTTLYLLATALLASVISSCAHETSSEEYSEKLKKKNEKYSDYNERRRLRLEARQKRTDDWFKRVMGT